jgi:matrixin
VIPLNILLARCRKLIAIVALLFTTQLAFQAATTEAYTFGPDSPCASSDYLYQGTRWPSGVYTYYTALDYTWQGGITARNQVLQGHLNWNYTVNPCGQPDTSPFAGWWGGGVGGWTAGAQDGVSFREMGNMAGLCPGAVACAPYFVNGSSGGFWNMVESDIRFNSALTWYLGGSSTNIGGAYDLQGVAVHESGHALGLADLYHYLEEDLSMFGYAPHDTRQRSLGWGDYTGMQALYP